jgi:hypothetical protein
MAVDSQSTPVLAKAFPIILKIKKKKEDEHAFPFSEFRTIRRAFEIPLNFIRLLKEISSAILKFSDSS